MMLKIRHLGRPKLPPPWEPGTTVEGVKTHGGGSRLLRWWVSASTVVGVWRHRGL